MNHDYSCSRVLIGILAILLLLMTACDTQQQNSAGGAASEPADDDDESENPAFPDGLSEKESGLTEADFDLVVDAGIDDRINSYPWAVELFDGDRDGTDEIYIGTIANALCLQVPMASIIFQLIPAARPPEVWQCNVDHWNPGNWLPYYFENLGPARVFRGTIDQKSSTFHWERVFEPGLAEAAGFRGGRRFKDALYMLGAARNGAVVYRTVDGETWRPASEPGVIREHAGYNTLLRATAVFKGKLYVASSDPASSFIYASEDPAPGNWTVVNSNGFVQSGGAASEVVYEKGTSTGRNTAYTLRDTDSSWTPFYYGGEVYSLRIVQGKGVGQDRVIYESTGNTLILSEPWLTVPDRTSKYEIYRESAPDNGPIYQMAVFNDRLYAAPLNYVTGGELWYSEDPAPGNWTRVIEGGFGSPDTEGFMTVTPFGDYLYLGTVVYPGYFSDLEDMMGTEILRVDADDNVELLVGATRNPGTDREVAPSSGFSGGFDYMANVYTWDAVAHDGYLYIGTFDAGGLGIDVMEDLYPEGIPDEAIPAMEAFLGKDHARWGGFDLFRTQDGIDWEPVSTDGFGNRKNYGIRSFASTPWGLLLGAANPYEGFEIWLGNRTEKK